MNRKLSVIVPIYNAEKYLERCVDSILRQEEKSIEVILVDDGSSDRSPSICDRYGQKHANVVVIHKANSGVSAARNDGIAVAQGDYIGFVDADDWIEPNMFLCLLEEAEKTNSDIVMCDATTIYDNGKIQADTITQLSGNTIMQKADFSPPLLLEMAGSAWRCIYSKRIYSAKLPNDCGIRFPLGVKFSEDRIFNLYAFGAANKVSYIKKSYYNRFMNKKSAVHRFHEDYFEAYKKAADEIKKAISLAWDDDHELQKTYLGQLITGAEMAICNYYYKTSPLSAAERKAKIALMCDDVRLRKAIEGYGSDRKSRWILEKKYNCLVLYAKLANWKHRR